MVFFSTFYRYIATIFSSLGSSEVEIKPKYVKMAAILKIQDGCQKNNEQLLSMRFNYNP